MDKGVVFFHYIFSQQDIHQNRNKCKGEYQGSDQCESERIGKGGKHLTFNFLKRKNRKQGRDYNDLRKKYGFAQLRPFFLYHPHFGQLIESFHSHFPGLVIQQNEQAFHHDDSSINYDSEINGSQ